MENAVKPNSYFWSDQYLAKSAADKAADLKEAIYSTLNETGTFPNPAGIFLENIEPTMTAKGDAMPPGDLYGTRVKYIHSVGAVG